MNKLKQLIVDFIINKLLRRHKFLPTTLIKTSNGSTLFEVEMILYDIKLEPVTIVKKYGSTSGQVYSISYPSILDYVEHKGLAPGGMEVQ